MNAVKILLGTCLSFLLFACPYSTLATAIAAERAGGPRTFVKTSGVYDCGGAKSEGFDITASNVIVQNCDISTQANGNDGYGIFVHGGAQRVTIRNNRIHDLCRDGIWMDETVSSVTVDSNKVSRASMAGVNVNGTNGKVLNNDISGTMQYPNRLGGIFAVCANQEGADADAIRFFGRHHLIRGNHLHDIEYGTVTNVNPHIDCFQTWKNADDILIEGNTCHWPASSAAEIGMIEGKNGPVGTVTIRHNVFANMHQGVNIGANVGAIVFENNIVDHVAQEVVIFTRAATVTPASSISNNIFYDCGSGNDSYTTSLVPVVTNNLCRMRSGARCGSYPVDAPAISEDPLFVSNGTGSAPWTNADYHFQMISPVRGLGAFPLQ